MSKYIPIIISLALAVYCSITLNHWVVTHHLFSEDIDGWTKTEILAFFALLGLSIFSGCLFVVYLQWNESKFHISFAGILLIFSTVYLIAGLTEITHETYCNYYLCWIQILKCMTLPVMITIILFLSQFSQSPSDCIINCQKLKIHTYAILFLITGSLIIAQSFLIYKNIGMKIAGIIMSLFAIGIIIAIDKRHRNALDWSDKYSPVIYSILIDISALCMFLIAIRSPSDEIFYYLLLFVTAFCQIWDVRNYMKICGYRPIHDQNAQNDSTQSNSDRAEGE